MNRNTISRITVPGFTAILALAGAHAHAILVNWGGDLYYQNGYTAPFPGLDLSLNHTEDNTDTYAYLEQYNVTLRSGTYYNANLNGTYPQSSSIVRQTIPGGGIATINSYILHFDPGFLTHSSLAFFEFDNPIFVISRSTDLGISDMFYGMTGVQYPHYSDFDRGFDLGAGDAFMISTPRAGRWRLDWYAHDFTGMDELRVIEMVNAPAPASLALLGMTALTAGRRRR